VYFYKFECINDVMFIFKIKKDLIKKIDKLKIYKIDKVKIYKIYNIKIKIK